MPARKKAEDKPAEEEAKAPEVRLMGSTGGGQHTKPISAGTGITVMTVGHATAHLGAASPGVV